MPYPTKKLGEICDIKLGGTPPRNNLENFGGDFLWCSIRDMKKKYIYDTKEKLTELGVKNSNVKLLKKGTLFMSFKLSLGKLAFAGKDLYTNEAISGFDIFNEREIDKCFLYYILLGYDFSNSGTDNSVKGKTLNKAKLEKLPIPLPPLPTQKLIVQKLDSVFKNIDESIEITKKNIENIEELNKSVLEEIFKEGNYKMKEIEKIFKIKSGNFLPKSKMVQNGKYNVYGGNGINGNHDKSNLDGENIIIGRVGALCGNVRFIKGKLWLTDNAFYISNYIIKIDKKYLSTFLGYINLGKTSNSSAQPVISYKTIKNIKIPLPPLPKQKEIVAYLDKVFEKNKALKESYEKKMKDLEEMKQSVLREAFENEEFVKEK